MKTMPDNCIDTVITDPPYGLEFMGKEWDKLSRNLMNPNSKKDIERKAKYGKNYAGRCSNLPDLSKLNKYGYEIQQWHYNWATEALRVAKPGATLLCFGGTRTYHRLACAIEDAGWILKDCIMWIYGSGFPKATDISKQIDKMAEKNIKIIEAKKELGKWLKDKRGDKPQKEISKHFLSKTGGLTGCVANWELGFNLPTWEIWIKLKELLDLDNRFDYLIEGRPKNYIEAERKVMGKDSRKANSSSFNCGLGKWDITAPVTPEATLWNGWKSHGLKPAYEPILVCMKPNEVSYANNALKWGVAGLNIDGGRIGTEKVNVHDAPKGTFAGGKQNRGSIKNYRNHQGRYPANVILDEESAGLLDEQAPKTGAFAKVKSGHSGKSKGIYHDYAQRGDDGTTFYCNGLRGASRFFYCAKASKSERNRGCEGLENVKFTAGNYSQSPVCKDCGKTLNGTNDHSNCSGEIEYREMKSKKTGNNHPTVKPLALMKYLCTLTKTPTGGIVLDPFCGSGTTLMACKELKRDYIGIDNNPEYCEIARKRVNAVPESLF
ncbi:site-specific DNA-methyltransferase [Candidatus Atribacteria bacterium 1244-E10-H5-B2]|nr:MAG: site-specific DNA-methyltransferase [Candidatus Atribacteria bacterium 1244-E10-H5-B2]